MERGKDEAVREMMVARCSRALREGGGTTKKRPESSLFVGMTGFEIRLRTDGRRSNE